MKYAIINREFRDYAEEVAYPFQDTVSLVSESGIRIYDDVFLDALVTSFLDVELPFHVGSLDGTYGTETQMKIFIKDKNDRDVCSGIVDVGTDLIPNDTAYLYDTYNRMSGVMVFKPTSMLNLIRSIFGKRHEYTARMTSLLVERCFVSRLAGLSSVIVGNQSLQEDVVVVGANGVHFTTDGATVYVHLLGEEPSTNRPIKSINGIERPNIWLAARPSSAVKVETKDVIKIWNIKDDN